MTPLGTLIDSIADAGDGRFTVNASDDWRQGRTLYGGVSAGLCYAACERLLPDLPPLRSAQVAFIGPSGGEATLVPTILRRGKSVTFMACDLLADGVVATRTLFAFGGERESAFAVEAPAAPDVPPPEDCPPLFRQWAPTFAQHFDMRMAAGSRPVTGANEGEMVVVGVQNQPGTILMTVSRDIQDEATRLIDEYRQAGEETPIVLAMDAGAGSEVSFEVGTYCFVFTLAVGADPRAVLALAPMCAAVIAFGRDRPVPAPPRRELAPPFTLDPRLRSIYTQAACAANSELHVLIRGESGTGKELFARYLHRASGRADDRFVAINEPCFEVLSNPQMQFLLIFLKCSY